MSVVNSSQPQIRFSKAGPYGVEGVSWEPKVLAVEKTWSTASENEDFWTFPAKTFIKSVLAVCSDAGDANTLVAVGLDGSAQAFITQTAFTVQTVGNSAVYNTGYYSELADTMRITIAGTPVAGAARLIVEYYELGDMFDNHEPHFDL